MSTEIRIQLSSVAQLYVCGSSVTCVLKPQVLRPLYVSKHTDIHQRRCQVRKLTAFCGSINNPGNEAKRK